MADLIGSNEPYPALLVHDLLTEEFVLKAREPVCLDILSCCGEKD